MVYGLLTGVLFLVYYLVIGLGSGMLSILFVKAGSIWTIAAATLVLGLLFNPLQGRVVHYVDKYFYPEKFRLRRELPALSRDVASVTDLRQLSDLILERLSRLLGMTSAAFLLADEKGKNYLVAAIRGTIHSLMLERSVILSAGEDVLRHLAGQGDSRSTVLTDIRRETSC